MNREEFLKYACESINSDLKFAETKNTFLTTFNLAIIGAVVSFLFDGSKSIGDSNTRIWFISFIIVILISTFISILSFLPLNSIWKCFKPKKCANTNFLFYKCNFSRYRDDFDKICRDVLSKLDATKLSNLEKQLVNQILDLSRVAYTKFMLFTIALLFELISFPLLIGGICS